jgi:hypothetical protein
MTSNEKPLIYERMAAVMADIEAIAKGQTNASQGFKYRGIDDVYNSLHTILAKHQIFTTPEVLVKDREERTNKSGTVLAFTTLRMKYTFWTVDGSNVSCVVEGEGMDSGDKSSNKAMAVAHKYALTQTFVIPTAEEKDPDAHVHEVEPKHGKAAPKNAPKTTGKNFNLEKVLKQLGESQTLEALDAVIANWKPTIDGWNEDDKKAARATYAATKALILDPPL